MATLERLDAADLASVVVAYRDSLRAHQEAINRLNVYPVPDGDTGTNMALTLEAVVAELPDPAVADLPSVCEAVSHGSLMGARGNSGIILSQILRGVAEVFREDLTGDGGTVADALARASDGAYQAVMRPVEGTILSVVKAASSAAQACRARSLVEVLDAARVAGAAALAATPEQLPVLKAAGVVDAGGAGFVLLLDAFLHRSAARPLPLPDPAAGERLREGEPRAAGEHSAADLRYEVMFLLESGDERIADFRRAWAAVGDSVVVVGGDGTWNCHIHTDDIGAAIEAALDAGRPRRIQVTDLLEQAAGVAEERWVRGGPTGHGLGDAAGGGGAGPSSAAGGGTSPSLAAGDAAGGGGAGQSWAPGGRSNGEVVEVGCAAVAVAMGEGIHRIFASLGAQAIVAGGQSMNPSTAQLLAAIDAAPGHEVVILPNNKNIVPVAEQAAKVAAKPARVVPTRSVAEGLAALLAYDPEAGADDNAEAMSSAAARVVSGEITAAVRSATSDAGPINAGDWLGLSQGTIVVVAPTPAQAAEGLLEKLLAGDPEIVTVIEGKGASRADTVHITEWLARCYPGVVAEVHWGGQPLYPYLVSIE